MSINTFASLLKTLLRYPEILIGFGGRKIIFFVYLLTPCALGKILIEYSLVNRKDKRIIQDGKT
jgi:hypothetical protein